MAWVRIDDQAPRNEKMLRAGPSACWLWVCGIAHAQSQLTNGFISDEVLPMIGVAGSPRVKKLAEQLVVAGLFERAEGGYLVHHYLDHNPSRTAVLAKRAEDLARKQAGDSRRNPRGVHTDSSSPRAGVPSDPIPSDPLKASMSAENTDFETFRAAYPASRRVGGKAAQKAFHDSGIGRHGESLASVLLTLEQHKRSEQWQTPKLIPLMTTWLNQERWLQSLPESTTRIGVRTTDRGEYDGPL